MKILVVGKSGQVGSDLVNLLSEKSVDFTAIDRNELDLSQVESIREVLSKYEFDYLINCAAYTQVDLAETEVELATKINALAVGELASVCKEKKAKLIHISTDYVFSGDGKTPYQESDETDPQSVYGMSKLQGEELALNLNEKTWILRTAWVYGENGSNFPKTIGKLLKTGRDLEVVDDQIGAPTWSFDLAKAIINLIEVNPPFGIYNCTNQGEISWFEFACEIAKTLGVSPQKIKPVKSSHYLRPAKRPNYSVLSNQKWIKAGLRPMAQWQTAWKAASANILR